MSEGPSAIQLTSRSAKRLADILPADAFRFNGSLQTFQGFDRAFAAEGEGLEVDGQKIFGAGVIGHLHGLFGRAMGLNPGRIGADGHDGQFEGAFTAERAEGIAPGRVTAKNDFLSFARNDVAVVTAVGIVPPTGAPVADFKRLDFEFAVGCVYLHFVAPFEFHRAAEPGVPEQVGGGVGGDRARGAGKMPQGGGIEVIHVRVREQHQVDAWQLLRQERRRNQPFRANGAEEHIRSHVIQQDRVGQNVDAVKVDQNRGMAEPGGGDAVGIPG